MIKFLHTADLHLGKTFHDQSLIEDQAAVLGDLVLLLKDGGYDALVIAGDVYDRSIPSPEAVELFGSFLGKVKALSPSPELILVPGNHDSAARLGFGREIFARLGIRLGVSAGDCDKPVIIEKEGETYAFFLLPFLNAGDLFREDPESGGLVPLRSQSALAAEAAGRMERVNKSAADYSVLVAHLFAAGGTETGTERVFLGSAELVNTSVFKGFDYIALGHLHRCQSAGEHIRYSGSPLVYSFGEVSAGGGAEKFFLSVELGKAGVKTEKIPVKPLRKVTSLSGPFSRFSGGIASDAELLAARDDYLEIRLTGTEITENAGDILRKKFPRLLSLRQDEALARLSQAPSPGASPSRGERRDLSGDFKNFLLEIYAEADPEKLALFDELLAETGEALP